MKKMGNRQGGYSAMRIRQLIICLMTVLSVTALLMPGCRSAKKIQTAISKKDTTELVKPPAISEADLKADSLRFIQEMVQKIESHRIRFNTFSAKAKFSYEGSDGKNSSDLTCFIRIQKDQKIWMLINAAFGLEAFRVLITPDSVKVLSKFKKFAQLRSVSYLRELSHLPVDFGTLQDLLVGNAVYLDSNIAFYRKDENGVSLLSVGEFFKNYITLNNADYTIKHSKLDDADPLRARTCDLTYGEYERKDTTHFSTYRKISVAEKSRLDIEINFKQYNFNEPLSFPFSIPKNYKRK
ncbi:MAG: DUF4292 domain-containing protein [Chitinophagales bacterium]